MANESNVVTVTVILQPGGITRQGFGIPLILSNTGNAWGTPELVRTYADIDSVEADFATTTPEYQAANALFAQPIKPALIMIGKGPSKPTQIKDLSISSVVAGQAYTVNVYSDGALQQVSYTAEAAAAWQASHAYTVGQLISNDTGKFYICITAGTSAAGPATGPSGTNANITDGTAHWMYSGAGAVADASNDAIVYNLQNALNALAAPAANFTATLSGSVGSKILVSTGDAAGNWFALEPLASGDISAVSNLMAIVDVTTNPGVASDLADILSANSAWYALVLLFKSAAIVATPSTGAAAWCESNERLLLASFSDTASATTAYSGGTDALHTLAAAGYSYTAGMWHPRDYEWFDAAKLGYFLPLEPGSDNWRLKTYVGVTACNFTGTQYTNLIARRAALYYVLGGLSVDGGNGQVCSTTYLFIDIRRDIDWYRINLQADLVDLEIQSNKLASTNSGRRIIATTIKARNDIGVQKGVISPDVPQTVYVPPAGTPGSYNATTRALSGITTGWTLANAVNSMAVLVNVSQG